MELNLKAVAIKRKDEVLEVTLVQPGEEDMYFRSGYGALHLTVAADSREAKGYITAVASGEVMTWVRG